jgi:hypothetical protein
MNFVLCTLHFALDAVPLLMEWSISYKHKAQRIKYKESHN